MAYMYANVKIKDYLTNIDISKPVDVTDDVLKLYSEALISKKPEFNQIYTTFNILLPDAISILTDEEIALFKLKYECGCSQKDISIMRGLQRAAITKRFNVLYRKLAMFFYNHEIIFDEALPVL